MNKIYLVSWNGTSIAGGVERVMSYIQEVLSSKYEVIVVCDELLKKNSRWNHWLIKNYLIKAIGYSLYVTCHKRKGDYVISNGFQAPFVRTDYLWVHGTILEYHRRIRNQNYYRASLTSILELVSAHLARKIICVAAHVKKEHETLYHVSPKKMSVLPNTVDCTLFYPMPARKDRTYITIIYVGRIEAGKGLKELLGMSSYIESISGYRLMIVTQSEKNETRRFANRQHTTVYSKVSIENLNEYYNQADVLYLPSSYEGFEMVTLESLSAGVPVVGYRVGAIDELVKRGQRGVCILHDKTVETALTQMTKMALKYKNIKQKERLHEEIQLNYGIDIFVKNLQAETALL